MGSELSRVLPRWLSSGEAKKFPWDDERYWKKEGRKISKEPRDYARQIGMDIENQTVETEDGYYLRWVYLFISRYAFPKGLLKRHSDPATHCVHEADDQDAPSYRSRCGHSRRWTR
jgi:hypothetical protein